MSTINRHRSQKKNPSGNGFVLPLVVIVGFIVAVGGAAMLIRSFAGLYGATRQEQSRQAREIAETGLATTVELLNRNYSYLLINCYAPNNVTLPSPNDCISTGTWESPHLPSSVCPGSARSTTNIPYTKEVNNPRGRYTVNLYAYAGTQFYGGTGKIMVTGERLSSDGSTVLAKAKLQQSFDVKPKPCDARFGETATSSGFPGLLGWKVNLGNNDVKGLTSGNVLCILCTLNDPDRPPTQAEAEAAVNALSNSDVDGKIFIGDITPPPVETFPNDLLSYVTRKPISGKTTITAQASPTTSAGGASNNGMCATDNSNPPITHCLVSNITLSGQSILSVNTTAGPVRLYVNGNVTAGGQAGISHDGEPGRFSLFGNPISSDPRCSSDPYFYNQEVTIAGTSKPSKAANVFAYFPCGRMGINGGAQATATCTPDGECGGGDVSGALWTKIWNGSASNQAQLVVPANMASQLLEYFGTSYAISVRDYIALGVNSWRGFQGFAQ